MATLIVHLLSTARDYIRGLRAAERGAIGADIQAMSEGDFDSVTTKQLKGPIRELIKGDHRISYFAFENLLCFVRGFPKKTNKAPRTEIEFAEKTYKQIKQEFNLQKTKKKNENRAKKTE
jgi:phage-related protein